MMKKWMSFLPLRDKRLIICALLPALLFALLTVVGGDVRADHSLDLTVWQGSVLFLLWTVVYGAMLFVIFSLLNRKPARERGKESLFARISGNFFVVLVLLLICWIPVWLAFWPGLFSADSITQFYSYYNGDHSSHHPLVHTLLLGSLMVLGIDLHPEAHATWGLAMYCGVQMLLVAACVAYAVTWLRRRGVPTWIRVTVTLLFMLNPFYAPWNFNSQKDVLFGVLVLVFCLQLVDLWRFGLKPLRAISFVLIAVLMMLFRNNGIYALALVLPFAVWWAKGRRIRVTALVAGSMALYMAVNAGLAYMLEAEEGSKVEMLSIPLQQIARTLKEEPAARELDEEDLLNTLYEGSNPAEVYSEIIADPVKWSISYALLDENLPELIALWAKMGVKHFDTYVEAFVEQNLPYLLPGSDMEYRFDYTVKQTNWFPIVEYSYFPKLRAIYKEYDETLNYLNIPGMATLADAAFYVWLCVAGLAYAGYRRKRGLMAAFGFLLAVWVTSLLGPIALMRYVLGIYYSTPVLLAALWIPERSGNVPETK